MAWLELHQAVWTHRKTFELAGLLRLDETYAAAHVIRLWTWAIDNAPNGDLSSLSDRAIAFGAGWKGEPSTFLAALRESGWLDENRAIHDWYDYAGRLVQRREENAKRMRRARSSRQGAPDILGTSGDRAPHVQGLHNRTQPDTTGPDPTPPTPPPHGGVGGEQNGVAPGVSSGSAARDPAPSADDVQLWRVALEHLPEIAVGNREQLALLEPVGRNRDGGLCLRAPPHSASERFRGMIARALLDAGDAAATRVSIVEA